VAADYEIVAQRQTAELLASGRVLDVWEVTAIVPAAHVQLIVRVPLQDSTPQGIAAALAPRVANALAVAGL
jgi:hypothetical protein